MFLFPGFLREGRGGRRVEPERRDVPKIWERKEEGRARTGRNVVASDFYFKF